MAERIEPIAATSIAATLLGAAEAITVAWQKSLGAPDAMWLALVAGGAYGGVALLLSMAIRLRSVAWGVTGVAGVALLLVQLLITSRALHGDKPRPQLYAEILARITLSLLLLALLARLLPRRLPAALHGRSSRLLGAGVITAAALAVGLDTRAARVRTEPLLSSASLAPDSTRRSPSILLALVDTLRADRVGAYGQPLPLTPFLDRLARQGIVFSESVSHSSWTKPETASLLTSLHPSVHGATDEDATLPQSVLTLPEILATDGYLTLGFSGNGSAGPAFNFQQGFSEFSVSAPWSLRLQSLYDLTLLQFLGSYLRLPVYLPEAFGPTADTLVEAARHRIARVKGEGVFLYLHLMDPHSPYLSPAGRGPARKASNFPSRCLEAIRAYEGEVLFADLQIARLIAALQSHPSFRDGIVVVTADHGEEFYEHGNISHGFTLYEELLRVPLLVSGRGRVPEGVIASHLVRGIDVAPTILEIAGMRSPPDFQGQSALRSGGNTVAYHEEDFCGVRLQALRDGRFKLIVREGEAAGLELFDLAADPAERRNLAAVEPLRAARLLHSLTKARSRLHASARRSDPPSSEGRRILQALGYVR